MRCPRTGKMVLVIFRRFVNFGPFFEPLLGTVVENAKHKRVAPGNSLKILALIFGSLKCTFPKCTFSEPQLSLLNFQYFAGNNTYKTTMYNIKGIFSPVKQKSNVKAKQCRNFTNIFKMMLSKIQIRK